MQSQQQNKKQRKTEDRVQDKMRITEETSPWLLLECLFSSLLPLDAQTRGRNEESGDMKAHRPILQVLKK